MDVPSFVLEAYPPDRYALIEHLRSMLDKSMQRAIVEADGGHDARTRWSMIRSLVKKGRLPDTLDVYQTEAWDLTRWDLPNRVWIPAKRRRRHITRAFACNALMIATMKPWEMDDPGVSEALAAATESVVAIPHEASACPAQSA